nr:immunoglobulin light chain junction region [Macaca mulatta]MPO05773.1 immunoglobulin light chain junction region [Macaca mulatta]MPO06184.1 immunoglobulin light chain junction region [Macaca mulatta]MPO06617.1 immunoglobulin light chain junction region [Macaca mulatta]MPO06738.1 immunoglobulin light chain junction region [Macaca mulatta]
CSVWDSSLSTRLF